MALTRARLQLCAELGPSLRDRGFEMQVWEAHYCDRCDQVCTVLTPLQNMDGDYMLCCLPCVRDEDNPDPQPPSVWR